MWRVPRVTCHVSRHTDRQLMSGWWGQPIRGLYHRHPANQRPGYCGHNTPGAVLEQPQEHRYDRHKILRQSSDTDAVMPHRKLSSRHSCGFHWPRSQEIPQDFLFLNSIFSGFRTNWIYIVLTWKHKSSQEVKIFGKQDYKTWGKCSVGAVLPFPHEWTIWLCSKCFFCHNSDSPTIHQNHICIVRISNNWQYEIFILFFLEKSI